MKLPLSTQIHVKFPNSCFKLIGLDHKMENLSILLVNDYCLNAKLRTQAVSKHALSLVGKYNAGGRAPVGHLTDREVLFLRSSLSLL